MDTSLLDDLRQLGGVATSAELQARLGVSQPTVSRALAPLLRAGQVLKVGAARAQRYLLPRQIEGVGSDVPLMRVDAQGKASAFGRMVPLPGGRFWVDEADGVSELHDALPWFLQDMRPQGFMGRAFVQAHPELRLPGDLRHWSDDDVLKALVQRGDDLPGNLIIGQPAFERFHSLQQRQSRVTKPERDYPALAEQAMQGTLPGSSAGGEQPKFCTTLNGHAVIVKFSPAGDAPTDQRWRDLLVCEHLALQTLAQAGLPAAETRIVIAQGRVFMEAQRFDRTAQGRIGMVSLLVYDAQYVGQMDDWAATSQRMAARRLLTEDDAAHLQLLDAFGALIANTDRHYGNISLLLEDDDWRLSPTYDMLPMLYAPLNGELVARDFSARPLHPTAHTLAHWPQACELAMRFWTSAAQDERISVSFKETAKKNRDIVSRFL
ncbi:type II toxin-antitoxin system HipA family toxin YjjJ [Hydrogenophaga sp.]|uniref:type II toxin-antitoxin system HipA family toxin YjjJ n=1 Tax=Hydrogenophaga sp. TaxID=1904254 RepID=UPI0027191CE6|nr:type II toxin-antitoxin system HipA family toxin YjjJ [Hydrogenophaga sp.]MDO9437545.1 type II toxin-antitoxin system HipA family toxin YjjJ [Hydrogenophaga sp.]